MHQERLSMTINASASLVETGETIWFYEWTHAEAHEGDDAIKVLAKCTSWECEEASVKAKHPPDEARMISGSNEAISKQKNAKDHQTAVYHKLLRDLVTNLATSFKHEPEAPPVPDSQPSE